MWHQPIESIPRWSSKQDLILLPYDGWSIGHRGPVRRSEVRAFLQNQRSGRDRPGKHNRVAAGKTESRLKGGRWGSVQVESGSEAVFVGGRDGHLDFGERRGLWNKAAVEMLHAGTTQL